MMQKRNRRLWMAFFAMILITTMVCGQGNIAYATTEFDNHESRYNTNIQDQYVRLFAEQVARQNDVKFDTKTKCEIISTVSSDLDTQGSALVLTNIDGTSATKDVFLYMDEDGPMELDTFEIQEAAGRSGTTHNYPTGESYVVHGTAVYNYIIDYSSLFPYYQPVGAYFSYYKSSPCNVSLICLEYLTDGFDYTYPGFELVQPSNEVPYLISVVKYDPVNNVTYSKTQPYPTNKVINVGGGSPSVGNFLTFYCKVDGVTRSATIPF